MIFPSLLQLNGSNCIMQNNIVFDYLLYKIRKMKKLLIIVSFVSWLINVSCNNSNDSKKNSNTPDKNNQSSQTTPGGGKGTISCLIDGTSKTFTVQQSFFEINLDPYSKGEKDGLEILDGNAKREGFQFEFKKSGTTKIKADATGDMNCIIGYYNPEGVVYAGEDVTVVVTSYNQNHLTGTFSGKLVNVLYDGGSTIAKNYPEFIQISDGKFNVQK